MTHPSRCAASLCWVSIVVAGWATVASAEPPDPAQEAAPEPEPRITLSTGSSGFADGFEGQVKRFIPSLVDTLDHLHLKNRAIEYRRPLAWEGHPLELRVRGGRFKGKGDHATRGYGLRVELRF